MLEEFVNHSPAARDLRILLVYWSIAQVYYERIQWPAPSIHVKVGCNTVEYSTASYILIGCIFHSMVQKGVSFCIHENLSMEDLPVRVNDIEIESWISLTILFFRSLEVRSP